MEIYGSNFTYAGISSLSDHLIIANVDTSRYQQIAGETKSNTVFSRRGNRLYYTGTDFSSSAVSFEADIVTEDGSPIPPGDIRRIEKWLFDAPGYRKLYIDECDLYQYGQAEYVDGVQKRLYLNARLVNASAIEGNGGIAGYSCTVECDSLMAWQDPIVVEVPTNLPGGGNTLLDITLDTDLEDYTYPKVTFQMGSGGGSLTIANNSDNEGRLTTFADLPASLVFTMNSAINYISGGNYIRFVNRNFIRLVDGVNHISILGNLQKITFEYQNRRYLK